MRFPSKTIIINSGRVGGTLLVQALDSHSQLKFTGEILNLNTPSIPPDARVILEELIGPLPPLRPKKANLDVPAEYIARLLDLYDGFKLLYYEINPQIRDYLLARSDVRIVHLKRWNALEQCVSQMIANKTKVYHLDIKRRHTVEKITIPIKALTKYFNGHRKDMVWHDGLFFNPYCVWYENLIDSWEETTRDLQKFIGVEYEPLPMKQEKVIQNPIQNVVENYRELREHFRGTEFEIFFKSVVLHL